MAAGRRELCGVGLPDGRRRTGRAGDGKRGVDGDREGRGRGRTAVRVGRLDLDAARRAGGGGNAREPTRCGQRDAGRKGARRQREGVRPRAAARLEVEGVGVAHRDLGRRQAGDRQGVGDGDAEGRRVGDPPIRVDGADLDVGAGLGRRRRARKDAAGADCETGRESADSGTEDVGRSSARGREGRAVGGADGGGLRWRAGDLQRLADREGEGLREARPARRVRRADLDPGEAAGGGRRAGDGSGGRHGEAGRESAGGEGPSVGRGAARGREGRRVGLADGAEGRRIAGDHDVRGDLDRERSRQRGAAVGVRHLDLETCVLAGRGGRARERPGGRERDACRELARDQAEDVGRAPAEGDVVRRVGLADRRFRRRRAGDLQAVAHVDLECGRVGGAARGIGGADHQSRGGAGRAGRAGHGSGRGVQRQTGGKRTRPETPGVRPSAPDGGERGGVRLADCAEGARVAADDEAVRDRDRERLRRSRAAVGVGHADADPDRRPASGRRSGDRTRGRQGQTGRKRAGVQGEGIGGAAAGGREGGRVGGADRGHRSGRARDGERRAHVDLEDGRQRGPAGGVGDADLDALEDACHGRGARDGARRAVENDAVGEHAGGDRPRVGCGTARGRERGRVGFAHGALRGGRAGDGEACGHLDREGFGGGGAAVGVGDLHAQARRRAGRRGAARYRARGGQGQPGRKRAGDEAEDVGGAAAGGGERRRIGLADRAVGRRRSGDRQGGAHVDGEGRGQGGASDGVGRADLEPGGCAGGGRCAGDRSRRTVEDEALRKGAGRDGPGVGAGAAHGREGRGVGLSDGSLGGGCARHLQSGGDGDREGLGRGDAAFGVRDAHPEVGGGAGRGGRARQDAGARERQSCGKLAADEREDVGPLAAHGGEGRGVRLSHGGVGGWVAGDGQPGAHVDGERRRGRLPACRVRGFDDEAGGEARRGRRAGDGAAGRVEGQPGRKRAGGQGPGVGTLAADGVELCGVGRSDRAGGRRRATHLQRVADGPLVGLADAGPALRVRRGDGDREGARGRGRADDAAGPGVHAQSRGQLAGLEGAGIGPRATRDEGGVVDALADHRARRSRHDRHRGCDVDCVGTKLGHASLAVPDLRDDSGPGPGRSRSAGEGAGRRVPGKARREAALERVDVGDGTAHPAEGRDRHRLSDGRVARGRHVDGQTEEVGDTDRERTGGCRAAVDVAGDDRDA